MIVYLDEVLWRLVLILAKMGAYVKTFMDRERDKDKNKNNKLMSLNINRDKLLEKYKTILAKIEDLQNIELNALLIYDDRYMKLKQEHMLIKLILLYTSYPRVYLDNCADKIEDKQMIHYA